MEIFQTYFQWCLLPIGDWPGLAPRGGRSPGRWFRWRVSSKFIDLKNISQICSPNHNSPTLTHIKWEKWIALFCLFLFSFSESTNCLHIWDLNSDDKLVQPETNSTSKREKGRGRGGILVSQVPNLTSFAKASGLGNLTRYYPMNGPNVSSVGGESLQNLTLRSPNNMLWWFRRTVLEPGLFGNFLWYQGKDFLSRGQAGRPTGILSS